MEDKRNQAIDIIKILAMIGVMALHATKSYIDANIFSAADIVYDLGIVSIPLFFMVSGFLLIPRTNATYSYVLRKTMGILRFVFIITFSFSFLYCIKNGFEVSYFINNFFGAFFQYGAFPIFWYFGAIILCYILLPLISKIYHSNFAGYTLILLVFFLLCNSIFSQTLTGGGNYVEFKVPATLRIWYIYFYFMLGGFLHRFTHIHINRIVVLLLFIGTIGYKEYFDNILGSEFASLFYSAPIVMALCAGIFLFIQNLNVCENRLVSLLSDTFLAAYTIHMFVISFVSKNIDKITTDNSIAAILAWFVVSSATIILSLILMRLQLMRKIFKI